MFDQDANLSPGGMGRPILTAIPSYSGVPQHQPQPTSPTGMPGMPGSFQWWAVQQQLASMNSQHSPTGYYGPGHFGGLPLAQPQQLSSPSGGGFSQPGFNFGYANRGANNNCPKPLTQQKRRAIYGVNRFSPASHASGVDKLTDSFGELHVQVGCDDGFY